MVNTLEEVMGQTVGDVLHYVRSVSLQLTTYMATIGEELFCDTNKSAYHDLNDAANVEGISRAGGSETVAPSPRGSEALAVAISLDRRARAAAEARRGV